MGGSGSDFSSGYSSGGSGGGTACESIDFEAAIASPDPKVIALIRIGDLLAVSKEGSPEQIVLRTSDDAIAGSIVEGWQDLLRCIPSHEYVALVIALDPVARVNVQWAP